MQPFPLVSIETRRHVPADPKLTRVGIGEARIDHAAGLPLRMRRAAPAPATDWDDQPNIHDARRIREQMYGNDAPVDLPLRSRSSSYIVAAALFAAFIAVCVSIFFSGISATTLVTRDAPATRPADAPASTAPPADVAIGAKSPSESATTKAALDGTAPGKFTFPPGFRETQRADSVVTH